MCAKVIAHVDMDAFFAAVEQRDRPELKGQPVVVGADPKEGKGRGVVSTCSYEARRYGIHSAQPISVAYQKCPHAVFLPGDHKKYSQESREIRKIFYDFTPDVEPISIDEAFLDITGSFHFYKTPYVTCQKIKERIRDELDLTASIGIAPVKFIAKIASDYGKPDGLLEIKEDKVFEFLWPLTIDKLWGVGPKSQKALHAMGIRTIDDLAHTPFEKLLERFGEHGTHMYNLAHAIDPREVETTGEVKSVSHEHTFNTDTGNLDEIYSVLLHLSEKVSRRLRKLDLKGKTITLKVRLKGFKTYTRAITIDHRTNLIDDIYYRAKDLFDEFYRKGQQFRLIGVRVTNFEDPYVMESLFSDAKDEKREVIHKAMDVIKDKFGEDSIHRGA